jgi:Methyltransferase FkbM domain
LAGSSLSREDVYRLYEAVLGRRPESEEIIETQLHLHKSAVSLTCALCNSDEFRLRVKGPYDHLFDGHRNFVSDVMTIERQRYHQAEMRATLALISPVTVLNKPKRRVGGPNDGGYVMLDDLDEVRTCYSLGVGPDVSWDIEMAENGAIVFQYDHTVEAPPVFHSNFRHFKIGITHDDALAPNLKRLDTLLRDNGHTDRDDMVLKVDIEGYEWDALDVLDSSTFAGFLQIVVEFHGMRLLEVEGFRRRAHRVFSTLHRTHDVIHVHANNFMGMYNIKGIPIADCVELTFVNRKFYNCASSRECFPGNLDSPNDPHRVDLVLGPFIF